MVRIFNTIPMKRDIRILLKKSQLIERYISNGKRIRLKLNILLQKKK